MGYSPWGHKMSDMTERTHKYCLKERLGKRPMAGNQNVRVLITHLMIIFYSDNSC